MDTIRVEDLVALGSGRQEPCISIFMPAHRTDVRAHQGTIQFKNHVRDAETQLHGMGLPPAQIRDLLDPLRKLTEDRFFWQNLSAGLAVYRASDYFRTFRLPVALDDLVVVTDRFHVKPLLRIATEDERFYVLALSQKTVRLLRCNRFNQSVISLPPEATPEVAIAQGDMPEPQLQAHSAGSGPQGTRIFHGNPAGAEVDKQRMLKHFHRLDHTLKEFLGSETAPLLVASVDYLLPIFREANTYPHLYHAGISGNPDQLRDDELRAAGWAVLEPQVQSRRAELAQYFNDLKPAGRASSDLSQVVKASAFGRVNSLMVAAGAQVWGRFDSSTLEVEVHDQPEPGDEDLVDLAAIQALERSGSVVAVPEEAVPDRSTVAATFRY